MYKEMHGVFEVIEDAIDAAYEAQRILEANYTTEDRQKFIDAVLSDKGQAVLKKYGFSAPTAADKG